MRLVVIGGGAAGFFCAVNAARMSPGLEVIIVEKSSKLLSKVRISGGGRCNLTHACFDITEMARRYPRGGNFVKRSFHQFFTSDTIEWFQSRGVETKSESDGRMFPVSDSSESVIDCLLREANRYHVQILMNREVKSLERNLNKWKISFVNNEDEHCDFVCIASGGYPKPGMFSWITQLGHNIEPPVPSLFTFNMPGNPITALMGISVPEVQVKIAGSKLVERGPLLITHWGMSGPVILRLSAWGAREFQQKNYEFHIIINWLPGYHEQSMKEELVATKEKEPSLQVSGKNQFGLPQRLWQYLLKYSGIPEQLRWAELPAAMMNKLAKFLCSFDAAVKGKTTFKEEFVTAGGIRLKEVDVNTMSSRIQPQLFFAGEILDVDGITGGYNFQHAWTSGYIAAKTIAGIANAPGDNEKKL